MSKPLRKNNLRSILSEKAGLWRSLLIYHAIPFRRRRITNFYRMLIKPGDLCFDIGAHVGNRLGPWTALGARVVAVEPQPQLMGYLKRQFGGDPRITLLESALGEKPGTAEMYVSTRNPTVTSLSRAWIRQVKQDPSFSQVKWDRKLVVNVTTLDALIEQYGLPALVKIDVEGYELQVLKGLTYPVAALSFEFIPAAVALAEACILETARIGTYAFNYSTGEKYQLGSPEWLGAETMIELLHDELKRGRSGDIYARLVST